MKMDECWILTGGEPPCSRRLQESLAAASWLICADSGADYARDLGLIPWMICGDLDSVDPETVEHFRRLEVPFRTVPARKDYTDTELALELALASGATSIVLTGTDGRRLDHLLGNYLLTVRYAARAAIRIEADRHTAWAVTTELKAGGVPGETWSLIPLTDVEKVSVSGFVYPLAETDLKTGSSLGISNVLEGAEAGILVRSGVLLVVRNFIC